MSHVTRTTLSRSEGQRSKSRARRGHILWWPPAYSLLLLLLLLLALKLSIVYICITHRFHTHYLAVYS